MGIPNMCCAAWESSSFLPSARPSQPVLSRILGYQSLDPFWSSKYFYFYLLCHYYKKMAPSWGTIPVPIPIPGGKPLSNIIKFPQKKTKTNKDSQHEIQIQSVGFPIGIPTLFFAASSYLGYLYSPWIVSSSPIYLSIYLSVSTSF